MRQSADSQRKTTREFPSLRRRGEVCEAGALYSEAEGEEGGGGGGGARERGSGGGGGNKGGGEKQAGVWGEKLYCHCGSGDPVPTGSEELPPSPDPGRENKILPLPLLSASLLSEPTRL